MISKLKRIQDKLFQKMQSFLADINPSLILIEFINRRYNKEIQFALDQLQNSDIINEEYKGLTKTFVKSDLK